MQINKYVVLKSLNGDGILVINWFVAVFGNII